MKLTSTRRSLGASGNCLRTRTANGCGLGRWVVERTFAWLHNFRRLRTRYERRGDLHLHLAFLKLGATVICQRVLG